MTIGPCDRDFRTPPFWRSGSDRRGPAHGHRSCSIVVRRRLLAGRPRAV